MRQLEPPLQEVAAQALPRDAGHAFVVVRHGGEHSKGEGESEGAEDLSGQAEASAAAKSSNNSRTRLQAGSGPTRLPAHAPRPARRPDSPTNKSTAELLQTNFTSCEPPWQAMAGSGSCFVRTVAGALSGHVEAADLDAASSAVVFQDEGIVQPWLAIGCLPSEQRKHAARLCTMQLTMSFRCCRVQDASDQPPTPTSHSCPALHVIMSWQDNGNTSGRCYVALQADFRTQMWSLQRIHMPDPNPTNPDSSVQTSVQDLVQAKDTGLMEGLYCSLELSVRQGCYLTLRRPDQAVCVFSQLPLSTLLATRSPAEAKPSVRRRFSDLQPHNAIYTPVGLAARGCRLEFKHWEVVALPATHSIQAVVGTAPPPSAAPRQVEQSMTASEWAPGGGDGNSGRHGSSIAYSIHRGGELMLGSEGDDLKVSDLPPGLQAAIARKSSKTSGAAAPPPAGSPAAAEQAFPGLSSAAATAVAVSATAAANNRWSRKPYINEADPHLVEVIMSDIIRPTDVNTVTFDDIASLTRPKQLLHEAVVLPLVLPEVFTGIREPWKGVLLFGPPGTGKTLLARAVASVTGITFFSASSASLTSKWRGDSEKLVRTLFAVAAHYAPSIIFIDEIDALASSRDMDGEGDASRRFKAELLQQMDGLVSVQHSAARSRPHGTLVLAASNCPWDLDPALRRRLEKRLHIRLPDEAARLQLFKLHLRGVALAQGVDLQVLAERTAGYSGADIKNICRDAAMAPMRRMVSGRSIEQLKALRFSLTSSMDPVGRPARPAGLLQPEPAKGQGILASMVSSRLVVEQSDLMEALIHTRPSVGPSQLKRYEQWEAEFAVT